MRWTAFAMGLVVGTALGLGLSYGLSVGGVPAATPVGVRAAAASGVRAPAPTPRRISLPRSATPAVRHCADPERVVARVRLEREPQGREFAFYATGTLHNSCNHALVVQLDLIGVDDRGQLFGVPSPEPFPLMPGEQRPVFLPLGQFQSSRLTAVMVVPRCYPEAGLASSVRPPRCAHDEG